MKNKAFFTILLGLLVSIVVQAQVSLAKPKNSMRIGYSACQTIVWVLLYRITTVSGENLICRTTGR